MNDPEPADAVGMRNGMAVVGSSPILFSDYEYEDNEESSEAKEFVSDGINNVAEQDGNKSKTKGRNVCHSRSSSTAGIDVGDSLDSTSNDMSVAGTIPTDANKKRARKAAEEYVKSGPKNSKAKKRKLIPSIDGLFEDWPLDVVNGSTGQSRSLFDLISDDDTVDTKPSNNVHEPHIASSVGVPSAWDNLLLSYYTERLKANHLNRLSASQTSYTAPVNRSGSDPFDVSQDVQESSFPPGSTTETVVASDEVEAYHKSMAKVGLAISQDREVFVFEYKTAIKSRLALASLQRKSRNLVADRSRREFERRSLICMLNAFPTVFPMWTQKTEFGLTYLPLIRPPKESRFDASGIPYGDIQVERNMFNHRQRCFRQHEEAVRWCTLEGLVAEDGILKEPAVVARLTEAFPYLFKIRDAVFATTKEDTFDIEKLCERIPEVKRWRTDLKRRGRSRIYANSTQIVPSGIDTCTHRSDETLATNTVSDVSADEDASDVPQAVLNGTKGEAKGEAKNDNKSYNATHIVPSGGTQADDKENSTSTIVGLFKRIDLENFVSEENEVADLRKMASLRRRQRRSIIGESTTEVQPCNDSSSNAMSVSSSINTSGSTCTKIIKPKMGLLDVGLTATKEISTGDVLPAKECATMPVLSSSDRRQKEYGTEGKGGKSTSLAAISEFVEDEAVESDGEEDHNDDHTRSKIQRTTDGDGDGDGDGDDDGDDDDDGVEGLLASSDEENDVGDGYFEVSKLFRQQMEAKAEESFVSNFTIKGVCARRLRRRATSGVDESGIGLTTRQVNRLAESLDEDAGDSNSSSDLYSDDDNYVGGGERSSGDFATSEDEDLEIENRMERSKEILHVAPTEQYWKQQDGKSSGGRKPIESSAGQIPLELADKETGDLAVTSFARRWNSVRTVPIISPEILGSLTMVSSDTTTRIADEHKDDDSKKTTRRFERIKNSLGSAFGRAVCTDMT